MDEVLLRQALGRARVRYYLTREDVEDLRQEVLLAELETTIEDVGPVVDRLARRISSERTRTRRRLPELAARDEVSRERSTPPLCKALAPYARSRSDLGALRAAAGRAAREPGVLTDAQFRAFVLAYEEGRGVGELCRILRVRSARAVIERLRRVSRRIQRHLLALVSVEKTGFETPMDVVGAVLDLGRAELRSQAS